MGELFEQPLMKSFTGLQINHTILLEAFTLAQFSFIFAKYILKPHKILIIS